jgi:hypothetical protein
VKVYQNERNVTLKTKKLNNYEFDFKPIEKLLQAMRCDPVINKKVINTLKMDSYPRRLVLSNWLEKLRRNSAPLKLMQSLACLFDDNIAEKVLILVNDHHIQSSKSEGFSN